MHITTTNFEKVLLAGIELKKTDDHWAIDGSMQELQSLALAAGADVVGKVTQKLDTPSPIYYFGKGKLEELISLKDIYKYNTVIFNDELSPRQQRNLEQLIGVKVIDRTALILDIFAKRAQTKEGKLQVELAQHQYILPRLAGQWSHLERLGGGIGTRGPGESQLETDRRLIRNKIKILKESIESVRRHRSLYRQKRMQNRIPIVALVGYTNAGKSTLLNALCKAQVETADKPFSTLDPVTRKIVVPGKFMFLLTDTVGFIHKLPPTIVAAFRATLEELREADLLLNVVDITHGNAAEQFKTVETILTNLGIDKKLTIIALNKIDLAIKNTEELKMVIEKMKLPEQNIIVPVSASKGWGLDSLVNRIVEVLDGNFDIS